MKHSYFPLATNAFIGDTLHLNATEVGQYMLLLMAMWNNGGTLPNDPHYLKRVARGSVRTTVMAFFNVSNGLLTQKRLQEEAKLVQKKIEQARSAGKESARIRALKSLEKGQTDVSIPCQRNGNSVSVSVSVTKKKEKRARGALDGFDLFWDIYPHKVSKGAATRAWVSATKKATANEIISGVERYKASKPADRAWCNPSTFLNGERWLDKPSDETNGNRPLVERFNGLGPTFNVFPPAEKFEPLSAEEIGRRDAAIKQLKSAIKSH